MDGTSHESDSGEQASTNDDVESSQQWTTDFEDDSDTEEEDDENDVEGSRERPQHQYNHRNQHHHARRSRYQRDASRDDTDQSDSNDDVDYDDSDYGEAAAKKRSFAGGVVYNGNGERRQLVRGATAGTITGVKSATRKTVADSTQTQSDTETRNLLDDIGDFDDDCLDLQETLLNPGDSQHGSTENSIDPALFELSEEQYDYYANCFMYLLVTTQRHVQVDSALNGADTRIIEFFRKSGLDNCTLSRVWALADVNEDGFLNFTEFIVAMHIIVLHLKAGLAIPVNLPSAIRPSVTPVRQLVRLPNGKLASIPTCFSQSDNGPRASEELCGSTTTTSAASSSNSASNFAGNTTAVDGGPAAHLPSDGASSRGSNNSHSGQHHQSQFVPPSMMSTSLELNAGGRAPETRSDDRPFQMDGYEIMINSHMSANYDSNAQTDNIYGDFTNVAGCSSNGVKQHSLSDDHLHLYAQQREIAMSKFSDVPPVLVDSHPMALNALNTPLALLDGKFSSRGPPPQPPPRDYAGSGGGKGHGRSASLDLKTFSALSPSYTPKSTHSNHRFPPRNSENDDTSTQKSFPQQLETLNEDLNLMPRQMSALTYALREQSTQTDNFEFTNGNSLTSEYEDVFAASEPYEKLPSAVRCDLLKRLNDELECERVKLAQIRLQLQLRIEEAEQELQETTHHDQSKAITAGNVKMAPKSTAL